MRPSFRLNLWISLTVDEDLRHFSWPDERFCNGRIYYQVDEIRWIMRKVCASACPQSFRLEVLVSVAILRGNIRAFT